MAFLVIVGIVVAIIVIVKITKSAAEKEENALNHADVEVTNQRLKEAANSGTDSQTVVGYRAIEQVDGLRNSKIYPMVKEICMELLKRGYSIGYISASHRSYYDNAYISVYPEGQSDFLGTINWNENVDNDGVRYLKQGYEYQFVSRVGTDRKHLIQYFPFLLIDSSTPCTEAPPEWLMICAEIMKAYSVPITDPEWVKENPAAREYVNVMFR